MFVNIAFKSWVLIVALLQAEAFGCDGSGIDKVAGNLLYTIAAKLKTQIAHRQHFLAEYVGRKKIVSELQLTGTFHWKFCNLFMFLIIIMKVVNNDCISVGSTDGLGKLAAFVIYQQKQWRH